MMKKPRIFYFSNIKSQSDLRFSRGGQKVTVEHVNILREYGITSHIVTSNSIWDQLLPAKKTTEDLCISRKQFEALLDEANDFIVIPGRFLDRLDEFPGANKIIFIQGVFITLNAVDIKKPRRETWESKNLKAIFCVSEGNEYILKAMQPACPIHVISNSIETNFVGTPNKESLLLYPNLNQKEKNPLDTKAILHLLNVHQSKSESANRYEAIQLCNMSHDSVLTLMRKAKVLLFLGLNEGLPLSILEAMAHDVLVVAYNRRPMSDLLHPSCLFEINQLNEIVCCLDSILNEPNRWQEVVEWNRKKVFEYSQENQKKRLIEAWNKIME